MNPVENFRTTAQELVAFAQEQGIDLEPIRNDIAFQKNRRWIDVWRKDDLPSSGRAEEPVGTLHYNLQGSITILPEVLKKSSGAFLGMWSEAGTFEDMNQALELVRAWLLDEKEVDELPGRTVRRYSI